MALLVPFILMLAVWPVWATDLCGIINVPTTLKAEESPYRVVGDLYISPSARLTLEAGVTLLIVPGEKCGDTRQLDWADSNMISIKVDGALFITGSFEQPVRIVPENHQAGQIQWDGIRIRNKRPVLVQIENLRIAGAQKAIRVTQSLFHISNSIFYDNNTALWLEDEADIWAYNNLFTANRSAAISIRESNPTLLANIFYKNPSYGVDSDSRPKPRIEFNLFFGNGDSDCWRCPVGMGKRVGVNHKNDSIDVFSNLYTDPLFQNSASARRVASKDVRLPTQKQEAKDPQLHQVYSQARESGRHGLPMSPRFEPLGKGEWQLSEYSPALDAAPDQDFFQDINGTRGDLGAFGGKLGRTRAKNK